MVRMPRPASIPAPPPSAVPRPMPVAASGKSSTSSSSALTHLLATRLMSFDGTPASSSAATAAQASAWVS